MEDDMHIHLVRRQMIVLGYIAVGTTVNLVYVIGSVLNWW